MMMPEPYKPYSYFNWDKDTGNPKFAFTTSRQKALRKAQIISAMKRKGKTASASVYRARAAQLKREADKGILTQLTDWAREGLGIGELSSDEWQFMNEYKDITGDVPPIFENPYMLERMGKVVDKAFDVASVSIGVGAAAQGIKLGIKGTALASSQLVRAKTKSQIKKAIMSKAQALVKKRTVGGALKTAAKGTGSGAMKAVEYEYKASSIGEITRMMKKGFGGK